MKIFVSYSRKDAGDFANQIQRHLSSFNYDVFTDVDSIRVGDIWSNTIEENISNCDIFVVIVTHGALQSPEVEKEVLQAQKEKKTIVPCFHSGTRTRLMKWELNKIQGVDFANEYQLDRDLFLKIDNETIKKLPESRNLTKNKDDLSKHSAQWFLDKGKEWESIDENENALIQYQNAIKEEPENFLVRCELSFFLERIGKTNEALEAIEQAIDLKPTNTEVWYHKARILEKLQKYDAALKALDINLKLDSKDVKSWTNKTNLLEQMERYEEALKSINEIINIDSANINAFEKKGKILEKIKRNKEAIECYNKALAIDPNNASINSNKTKLIDIKKNEIINQIKFSYKNQDSSKVIELFNEIEEFDPLGIDIKKEIRENPILQEYKANAFYSLGNYQQALQCYNQVLAIDHKNTDVLLRKAQLLSGFTQYRDAVSCYDLILEIDPKNAFVKSNREIALNKARDPRWEKLVLDIHQGKCIPFLGESLLQSLNKIKPNACITDDEVAEVWAKKYNYPFDDPHQLPKVAQFLAIELSNELSPKLEMNRIITSKVRPEFSSHPFNKSPYALLAGLNFPIYITTNYDHLMEGALISQGKEPVSEFCLWKEELVQASKKGIIPTFKERNTEYPTPRKPLVFHFYGSMEHPSTMVLTEKDYFDFILFTNQPEFEKEGISPILRTVLAKSSLLFIGYNMDDLKFRLLFQGGLSFMSLFKGNNGLAVMDPPVSKAFYSKEKTSQENREELEKRKDYLQKYANNIYNILPYWGDINEFMRELLFWNESKNISL